MINFIINFDNNNENKNRIKILEEKEKIIHGIIKKNIKNLNYEEFKLLVKLHLNLLEEIGRIKECEKNR
ncbi:hypothetical protein [Helcococcus kunzii]|uniref:hypothetical protein n=1 Tax=Helcococcus kunzii TaxID=40091 RepID=UPI0024AD72CD|nr:hypothetical protein [Helcococcus kunzii]